MSSPPETAAGKSRRADPCRARRCIACRQPGAPASPSPADEFRMRAHDRAHGNNRATPLSRASFAYSISSSTRVSECSDTNAIGIRQAPCLPRRPGGFPHPWRDRSNSAARRGSDSRLASRDRASPSASTMAAAERSTCHLIGIAPRDHRALGQAMRRQQQAIGNTLALAPQASRMSATPPPHEPLLPPDSNTSRRVGAVKTGFAAARFQSRSATTRRRGGELRIERQ